MVEIRGRPLLQRLVDTLASCGIRNPVIVRGYKRDILDLPGIVTVDNDAYATKGELASLACARDRLNGDCLVTFGDVLVRRIIIDSLLDTVGDIVIAVDPLLTPRVGLSPRQEFVLATRSYEADYLDDAPPLLKTISAALAPQRSQGAWIGLVRFTAKGAAGPRSARGNRSRAKAYRNAYERADISSRHQARGGRSLLGRPLDQC
jgi:phosphoenolpyruvate phosphomutase